MVLDRTGFGAGSTVEHEIRPWEIAMQHIFVPGTPPTINHQPPEELEMLVVSPDAPTDDLDGDTDTPSAGAMIIHLPTIRSVDPPKRNR